MNNDNNVHKQQSHQKYHYCKSGTYHQEYIHHSSTHPYSNYYHSLTNLSVHQLPPDGMQFLATLSSRTQQPVNKSTQLKTVKLTGQVSAQESILYQLFHLGMRLVRYISQNQAMQRVCQVRMYFHSRSQGNYLRLKLLGFCLCSFRLHRKCIDKRYIILMFSMQHIHHSRQYNLFCMFAYTTSMMQRQVAQVQTPSPARLRL